MYKLLLSWRYLKTRFIALASIVSVTLGVATLIVVNSVMSGFVNEMQTRLHGILSDVDFGAPGLGEIREPDLHIQEILRLCGDDIEAATYVVRTPAFMNFKFRDRQWTQHVMLIGIDEETYGKVTDFSPFLTNDHKRNQVTFTLEHDGYDERIGESGWEYRRQKINHQRKLDEILGRYNSPIGQPMPADSGQPAPYDVVQTSFEQDVDSKQEDSEPLFAPLPESAPDVEKATASQTKAAFTEAPSGFDPHAQQRPEVSTDDIFDPHQSQRTGIILGMAIANRKYVDADTGEKKEVFMLHPGDDVQITMPTGGSNPKSAITENCTVVDFYSSNMHEYDSSFVFMPLREMQELRKMIDPVSGASTVSAIQIKAKPGADLDAIRDKLNARFPPMQFAYVIQTWQDTQRPLLSAVQMEVTILNILLFLIIAVAGFGILATFFMIVVEKTKDIGILKALGAPSRGVMSIFLSYGVCLGAVGTAVGIVLGLVFVYFINDIADVISWMSGREVFDPTIYFFSEIPTIVSPMMVFLVAIGAILIAVLASVLPALRAARLHPVEALRYE